MTMSEDSLRVKMMSDAMNSPIMRRKPGEIIQTKKSGGRPLGELHAKFVELLTGEPQRTGYFCEQADVERRHAIGILGRLRKDGIAASERIGNQEARWWRA